MSDTPALRPPPEHAHLRWHWIIIDGAEPEPAIYSHGFWFPPRTGSPPVAEEAWRRGWRYHGPCDPAVIVPDPTDAAMVEVVARAICAEDDLDPDMIKGECYPAPAWEFYKGAAVAALAAMGRK